MLTRKSFDYGSMIRSARLAAGKSIRGLAHEAAISSGHLQHIEAGQAVPSPNVLVRLATALGIDPAPLIEARRQQSMAKLRRALATIRAESKPVEAEP